ncbi:uncharacterized protein [Misgurnus anguillicaudatus]|uniref:uncharacterized protein n=1 Tax=Misgurnus anguillicaudatus TaxID=75329 RepID=UPI003CCF5614
MASINGVFGICLLLFGGVQVSLAMTVTIPQKEYKVARGDDATLTCTFTIPAMGVSDAIVSWTAVSNSPDVADSIIATYFNADKVFISRKYKGRASLEVNIQKGFANLKLSAVTSLDTRGYECKVQDPDDEEGGQSAETKLTVLVAPSTPLCKVVGVAEYGQNINLTCFSEEGTPTPTYKWQNFDVNNVPRQNPLKTTDQNGILSLYNISKDTSGYFLCTSTNELRSAKCNITLSVMPRVQVSLAMTVTIPQKEYKVARGDDATLTCTFTIPATGVSSPIVQWTAISNSPDVADSIIATYFSTDKVTISKKYKGRVSLESNIQKGFTNLKLSAVTSLDMRGYECKVQDPDNEEGGQSAKTKLTVLVAPSTPLCKVVGVAEYGQNINLTCFSEEGTPTPTYKWQNFDVNNVPRQNPLKTTDQNGILSLYNISKDTSGYFLCTSTNELRSAKCNITLSVMPRKKSTHEFFTLRFEGYVSLRLGLSP